MSALEVKPHITVEKLKSATNPSSPVSNISKKSLSPTISPNRRSSKRSGFRSKELMSFTRLSENVTSESRKKERKKKTIPSNKKFKFKDFEERKKNFKIKINQRYN